MGSVSGAVLFAAGVFARVLLFGGARLCTAAISGLRWRLLAGGDGKDYLNGQVEILEKELELVKKRLQEISEEENE